MKASTELFLWEMWSIAESVLRPSFRFGDESFEGWAHRNGLLRQMQRLERDAYLERQPGGSADRIYRLTPKGRLAALGGKDPEEHWSREWDGKWRLLMFDLPQAPDAPRRRLRRFLRENGLGCVQGSVWVSPDPLDAIRKKLKGDRHPSSLLLFEGNTVGGEKPAELVAEAWDFPEIRQAWQQLDHVLTTGKRFLQTDKRLDTDKLHDWAKREHETWKAILDLDPLLPHKLLPRDYPGRKTWKKRMTLWSKIGHRMRKNGVASNSRSRQ